MAQSNIPSTIQKGNMKDIDTNITNKDLFITMEILFYLGSKFT